MPAKDAEPCDVGVASQDAVICVNCQSCVWEIGQTKREAAAVELPNFAAWGCFVATIKMVKGVVGILRKVGSGLYELEWSTLSHT